MNVCQEIFSDEQSSDGQLATNSSFDQNSVEDSVDDQLLNSGFLGSDHENSDGENEVSEQDQEKYVPEKIQDSKTEKIPDQNFLANYTQTMKSAFLRSKDRIITHFNEPFGKGIIHRATGRPLDEVLREKTFPSPGAPMIDLETPPVMRVRKEREQVNLKKTEENVNGAGDSTEKSSTKNEVIDPYERELTPEQRAAIRQIRRDNIIESNLPNGPWWNVPNVEYYVLGFLVFCMFIQYGTIFMWGHPSEWEIK